MQWLIRLKTIYAKLGACEAHGSIAVGITFADIYIFWWKRNKWPTLFSDNPNQFKEVNDYLAVVLSTWLLIWWMEKEGYEAIGSAISFFTYIIIYVGEKVCRGCISDNFHYI